MRIKLEVTNDAGTRIDREIEINTVELEVMFAELAQGIKWAREKGSDRIVMEVTRFGDRLQ